MVTHAVMYGAVASTASVFGEGQLLLLDDSVIAGDSD